MSCHPFATTAIFLFREEWLHTCWMPLEKSFAEWTRLAHLPPINKNAIERSAEYVFAISRTDA